MVLPLLALVLLVVAACQSPRSGPPTQGGGVRPPVAEIPSYPWPDPEVRRQETESAYIPAPSVEDHPPPAAWLAPDVVRVALLLPLSGPNRGIGKALMDAAQLAVFDFAERNFELMPIDTQGTPEGAERAAHQAVSAGSHMILGPLLASSVRSAGPVALQAGIAMIAFSSDRSVAGEGVWTMGFLPGAEVARVTGFAMSRGIRNFAALAPANAYGETVVAALRETVGLGGASLERVRFFDPQASDFSEVIRELGEFDRRKRELQQELAKLKGKTDEISLRAKERLEKLQTLGDPPFEALLVADGGKRLQALAALLPYYDIDPSGVKMLGTGQWDEAGLGAEPALLGGWFAAAPPEARADFVRSFEAVYGAKPPRIATLAYDATALAALLGRAGGPGYGREAITDSGGFAGRDGIFRLLPNGLVERGLAVLEVERRGAKTISRAPETFLTPAY